MTNIAAVLSISYKSHLSCKHIDVLQSERGSWLRTQAFPASGGVSHSHAACLHWHAGLVQCYSTLPSLFGIVCFASCLHIRTHMLLRKQAPNIKPTTGTMGPVYWQLAKLMPGCHPKQSRRVSVHTKCHWNPGPMEPEKIFFSIYVSIPFAQSSCFFFPLMYILLIISWVKLDTQFHAVKTAFV